MFVEQVDGFHSISVASEAIEISHISVEMSIEKSTLYTFSLSKHVSDIT